jgi:hypothetical protein
VAYRIEVSRLDAPEKTQQGFLKAPAHLTRAGVFVYHNPDGSERREWRPTSEVMRGDSLATLISAPVTDGHPPEMVTLSNRAQYDKGNVGDTIVRDGGKVATVLYVKDARLISAIERNDAREISCGYHCDVEMTSGVVPDGEPDAGQRYDAIQKSIVYNHVAVVPQGRAGGEVRLRLDGAGNVITPPMGGPEKPVGKERIDEFAVGDRVTVKGKPHMPGQKSGVVREVNDSAAYGIVFDGMSGVHRWYVGDELVADSKRSDSRLDAATEERTMKVEKIDGVEYEIGSDAHKAAVARRDEAAKNASDELAKIKAERDAAKAEAEKARKDAAEAPAKAKAAVEARAKIEEQARKVLGAEAKFDGKDDAAIVAEVAKASGVKFDEKAEPAYVRALFDMAVAKADAGSLGDELKAARVDSVTGGSDVNREKIEQRRAALAESFRSAKFQQYIGRRMDAQSVARLVDRAIEAFDVVEERSDERDHLEMAKRLDAGESGFLTRELLQKLRASKEVKYAEMKGRQVVPISNEVDPGAELYGYDVWDRTGAAKLGSSYEGRAPRVDVKVSEVTGKIEVIRASFGWTVQDLRNAAFGGRSLPTQRGMAARMAMEFGVDKNLATGCGALKGLVNNANIPVYSSDTTGGATDLTGFTGGWATLATASDILTEIGLLISAVRVATKEVEMEGKTVDLVLPTSAYNAIASRPFSTTIARTVLDVVLETSPWIRSVTSWQKLNGAGVGSRDRALFYTKDAMNLEGQIPLEPMAHPVEQEALEFLVEMEARVAGVSVYFPYSAAYLDGV